VERMLLADVQAFSKVFSDHVKRHDEHGCMSKLELIRDLYGSLRNALNGFGDVISKHDANKQTAGPKTDSGPAAQPSSRPDRNKKPSPPPPSGKPNVPVKEKTSFFGGLFGRLFGKRK